MRKSFPLLHVIAALFCMNIMISCSLEDLTNSSDEQNITESEFIPDVDNQIHDNHIEQIDSDISIPVEPDENEQPDETLSDDTIIPDDETEDKDAVEPFVPENNLQINEMLHAGEYLQSENAQYRFYVQGSDGNLVLRDNQTQNALWAAGTQGKSAAFLVLQDDGNLVLYTDSDAAIWTTETQGSDATELLLEDDGTLALYGAQENPLWCVPEDRCSGTPPEVVDASTLHNKIMAGYQGWFMAEGDGANVGWRHWGSGSKTTPDPDSITFDMWPDLREYDDNELFDTAFNYADGTNAGLYSAYTPKTVERHVKWMKDYGIDGVFVQRFIMEAVNMTHVRDRVLNNIRAGAEKYGRVFANMYDISGGNSTNVVEHLKTDWKHLVDDLKITESDRYLHHNGKPVLSIWGFGFSSRDNIPQNAHDIIQWLTVDAPEKYQVTVKLGIDDKWQSHSAEWQAVYARADILSPWTVGRYGDIAGANNFRTSKIEPDLVKLNNMNIDYMPVVFPGFSWVNLKGEKFNHIKRNGGRFIWRQFYNAVDAGANMIYVAMFDEVDEGTAIYKVAENSDQTPTTGTFLTLDADGETLPSDWYLQLTGEASKMLRKDIDLTETIPISP